MDRRIYITGTGGQGVMLIGKSLAYGAFYEQKDVLFMPTYGGEQRGGASNCAIMVSDEKVGAPSVRQYDVVVFMDQGQYDANAKAVRDGGVAILNSSYIHQERDDGVRTIRVNAVEEAEKLGSAKCANMVMLGALAQVQDAVSMSFVLQALRMELASKPQLLDVNERAVARGAQIAAEQLG